MYYQNIRQLTSAALNEKNRIYQTTEHFDIKVVLLEWFQQSKEFCGLYTYYNIKPNITNCFGSQQKTVIF